MMTSSSQEECVLVKDNDLVKTESFMVRKRSLLSLIALSAGSFIIASVASLQAPFFPHEAEKKGATATQYGLVFGMYELVVFLMAPIAGKLVSILPPRFFLCSGILTVGTCCVLFGVLNYAPGGTPFLTLAFITRSVEGVGAAAYVTTTLAIVSHEFPDKVGTTFATVGTFFGLGLIAGPTLGGALYELGGYTLPFAVIGGILMIYSGVVFNILPHIEPGKKDDHIGFNETVRFWAHYKTLIPAICIFITFINIGFNAALLEPHIRQFNLTPFLVGLVFIVSGGVYGLTATVWGYITDKWVCPKVMCLFGSVLSSIFLLLIGPVPFLQLKTQLWLIIFSLVLFGLGSGMQYVCSFAALKRDTTTREYPENMTTNGLVSSVFATMQALGSFVGPSISGYLYDMIGYEWTSVVLFAFELLLIVVMIPYVIQERRFRRHEKNPEIKEEKSSLVESNKTVY